MLRVCFLTSVLIVLSGTATIGLTPPQRTNSRAIIADDFTKARPKSTSRVKTGKTRRRTYRLASRPSAGPIDGLINEKLQLGLTIWKLDLINDVRYGNGYRQSMREQWVAKRVEADTVFRAGDQLRFSIESPRGGYLYIINRDQFTDGSIGETNLIFPKRGENNYLEPGRLIDIPAADQIPFKASPKPNQAGEYLTIIVTSMPISLPVYDSTLAISDAQVTEWQQRWGAFTERFEMNGGAGLVRTRVEQQAALPKGARQLTREDPGPQTIFFLTPRSSQGLLFDLLLSYNR